MTREELLKLFEQITKTIHSGDEQLLNEINFQNVKLTDKIKGAYQKKYKIELQKISNYLNDLFEEKFRNADDPILKSQSEQIITLLNQLIDNL